MKKDKRDPSIHIKESDLKKLMPGILSKWLCSGGIPGDISIKDEDIEVYSDLLVKSILRAARLHPVNSRKVLADIRNTGKKYTKTLASAKDDVAKFQVLLRIIRKQLRHRGITTITESHRDWLKLKEVVNIASQFCEDFGLTKKEGFKQFIVIGLEKMRGRYMLHKFVSLSENIIEAYQAIREMEEFGTYSKAKEVYEYFRQLAITYSGVCPEYDKMPEKMVFFSRVYLFCETQKLNFKQYLRAQFEGLSNLTLVPDPFQLMGVNATARYASFKAEEKNRNSTPAAGVIVDFNKVKNDNHFSK